MEGKKQQYIEVFSEADSAGDDNGTVTPKELKCHLKNKFGDLTDEKCAEIFVDLDTNGDKRITMEEFLYEMLKPDRRMAYGDFFKQADTDNNGKLSVDELRAVMKENGLGEEEIEKLEKNFESLDADNDGKITSDEFMALV